MSGAVATAIRPPLAGRADDVMVTAGQHAGAKKILIGLYLLEAADLDAAISWAAHFPSGVARPSRATPDHLIETFWLVGRQGVEP
jgi:hypothetical protein